LEATANIMVNFLISFCVVVVVVVWFIILFVSLLFLFLIPRHPEVSHAALPTFSHVARIRTIAACLTNDKPQAAFVECKDLSDGKVAAVCGGVIAKLELYSISSRQNSMD
jgi:hypothetical protein